MARERGGILARSAAAARELLAAQREILPLHSDLHHDNVLDFGARGWLAIDPKCVIGERAFEYTILFCDPDLADPEPPVATLPGRFERRLEIVLAKSGLERERLLKWILAWCGLSATWFLGDDDPLAEINLAVAERAIVALDAG
jgi:streptomycin 6-kinase